MIQVHIFSFLSLLHNYLWGEIEKRQVAGLIVIGEPMMMASNFSHIGRPLHKLSNKAPFFWTSLANQQFQRLKEALCSAPVLWFPDLHQLTKIEMDASRHAIGAVLK